MNAHLILDALPLLAEGMLITLQLTLSSLAIGFLIAVPLALMRTSTWRILRFPILFYTFVFRGTPLLVQLFLIYYGASQLEFVRASAAWVILREPFWCALIAFSLNNAAYTTEILRGGINAVPVGEVEAAKAVGMSYLMRARRVVLPLAFRLALPAYTNEVVLMLKASSLASTITIMELTGTARKLVAQTFAPYEIFISAALLYLALTFVFVYLFSRLETYLSRHLKQDASRTSEAQAQAAAVLSPAGEGTR